VETWTKLKRLVDDKAWLGQLYVTNQCNLACHYCNEYDNNQPHPTLENLTTWMRKMRELGVMKIQLQGGEPLLHPDIVEVVRRAKEIGFYRVGMSSNGFLLTEKLVKALEAAGLDSLQISVDRMTPSKGTKKSLKTVLNKLDYFKSSRISMTVTGVLFEDNLHEVSQVIDTCLDKNIPVAARMVHNDLVNQRELADDVSHNSVLALLQYQAELKAAGEKIHTPWRILEYQLSTLKGKGFDWQCTAGYKYFCVSGTGQFWPCSQVRTTKHIMDVTVEDLKSWNKPKSCQNGCGVYCVISASFRSNHPLKDGFDEVREWLWKRSANRKHQQRQNGPSDVRKRGVSLMIQSPLDSHGVDDDSPLPPPLAVDDESVVGFGAGSVASAAITHPSD
jgi:MoaA/NifB/PqqE/SkfB family radical SAM enzyme